MSISGACKHHKHGSWSEGEIPRPLKRNIEAIVPGCDIYIYIYSFVVPIRVTYFGCFCGPCVPPETVSCGGPDMTLQ